MQFAIDFWCLQLTFDVFNWLLTFSIEFTQSTWFTTTKSIGKILKTISWEFFQLTFSLQLTLVNCTWSGPKPVKIMMTLVTKRLAPMYVNDQLIRYQYIAISVFPDWWNRLIGQLTDMTINCSPTTLTLSKLTELFFRVMKKRRDGRGWPSTYTIKSIFYFDVKKYLTSIIGQA